MAKQDDWIRITLRLPPALHARLITSAAATSVNAEIITRLEKSLDAELMIADYAEANRKVEERELAWLSTIEIQKGTLKALAKDVARMVKEAVDQAFENQKLK